MRAAAGIICSSLCGRPGNSAMLHERVHLCWASAQPLGEPFNENATPPVFSDHKVCPIWLQQVGDHLIVDLKVGRADQESRLRTLAMLDVLEQFLNGPWNDAAGIADICSTTLHCVRLPGACGPVCQNCCIVALQR